MTIDVEKSISESSPNQALPIDIPHKVIRDWLPAQKQLSKQGG
jgi:hypothetical protein